MYKSEARLEFVEEHLRAAAETSEASAIAASAIEKRMQEFHGKSLARLEALEERVKSFESAYEVRGKDQSKSPEASGGAPPEKP